MGFDWEFADEGALDADDVAAALHIARNTVYKLARTGELGSYRIGRKLRFTAADVEDYVLKAHQGGDLQANREQAGPASRTAAGEKGPTSASGTAFDRGGAVVQDGSAKNPFVLGGTDLAGDVLATCLNDAGIHTMRSRTDSYSALVDIYRGRSMLATVSLYDQRTNAYNTPYIQRLLPGIPVVAIRLMQRRQGLVVPRRNPKRITSWGGILKEGVRLANQRLGTSARILLDEKLLVMEANPFLIEGYGQALPSGYAVARAVSDGEADVGVTSEGIARSLDGVDFIPLQPEWVDLVVRKAPESRTLVREVKRMAASDVIKGMIGGLADAPTTQAGAIVYEC